MSLKNIFPSYPITFTSPKESNFKFSTRRIYVDLPWEIYSLYSQAMYNLVKGEWNINDVKNVWREFLKDYGDKILFNGKPLATIYVKKNKKTYLMIRVNWENFVEYLEDKAAKLLKEVKKDGRRIMNVYETIWFNFFLVQGKVSHIEYVPTKLEYSSRAENFARLLRRTKDLDYIDYLLGKLQKIIKRIELRYQKETIAVKIYTANMSTNIQTIHILTRYGSIPTAYALLRNTLESLIKLYVYLKLGKSLGDPNLVLSLMPLYEYRAPSITTSFKKFVKEDFKKYLKIESQMVDKEWINALDFIRKLEEKNMRKLGIGRTVLLELSSDFDLNGEELVNLYSACSEIIHNQQPLPFYSLLEAKFFKHFLNWYARIFRSIAEKIVERKVRLKEATLLPWIRELLVDKKYTKIARRLLKEYSDEIREIVKSVFIAINEKWKKRPLGNIFLRPLTLASIFHVIKANQSHIENLEIVESDLEDIILRMQAISFNIGIFNEFYETLDKLLGNLSHHLDVNPEFAKLAEDEKRKVALYISLILIPEILEEIIPPTGKPKYLFS